MDDSMLHGAPHYRADGFPGQRLCVVPQPQVRAALDDPITRRLTVTDAGYFPHAAGHRRVRARGVDETIVLLCTAGEGAVLLDGVWHTVSRAQCAVIPAGAPHEYRASTDDPWTIWWVHLRGSDVAELTGPVLGTSRPVTRLQSLDRAIALFDEIVGLLEHRLSPAALVAASGLGWQLLTRIAVDSTVPAEGSALERAMRYLEDRIDGTISVGELASLVGVSGSHLSALFRRATGGGPAAFHTSVKMTRARALLDTTDASIAEVATAVGYADPLYFSRHFRRLHGVSPSGYRAKAKG